MCTMSVVTGYGQRYPDNHWNQQNWPPFRDLITHAGEVDKQLGEPDCIDPEKDAWMKRIEARVEALEAAAFRESAKV